MHIRVLGIEIERKTDILAAAAFVMALGSALFQGAMLLRGPELILFPPEQILIRGEKYASGRVWVRFAAQMAYVNTGHVGHNAAVGREALRFSLGDDSYEQSWQTFESFHAPKGKLVSEERKAAHPFTVAAGSVVGHETYFAPRSERIQGDPRSRSPKPGAGARNFLEWDTFLARLSDLAQVDFEVEAHVYGKNALVATCSVQVTEKLLKRLEKRGWAAPSCFSS